MPTESLHLDVPWVPSIILRGLFIINKWININILGALRSVQHIKNWLIHHINRMKGKKHK